MDRLDGTNSDSFRALVKAGLKDNHRVVQVDFSLVRFIDSQGMGALLSAHKLVVPRGGVVRLTKVQPTVRGFLELLKLQQLFEINS